MGDIQESCEIDDAINKLLIDHIRERPTLYYNDKYTKSDEQHWDEIQKSTGIQKSWLKKRWKTIRNDHRTITIYNHMHSKKVPPHKMAKELDFFLVDLNGAKDMDFEEIKRPKKESFFITQEMLDNCDINESVTIDSISMPKFLQNKPTIADAKTELSTAQTQPPKENTLPKVVPLNVLDQSTNKSEKPTENDKKSANSSTNERCEDTIFGELVVAMLMKMKPEEKKQAKKEIMNILL